MAGRKPQPRAAVVQPLDESIRYIALTQNQVAVVSAHRYAQLVQFNWTATWCEATKTFYAYSNIRDLDGLWRAFSMHRFIKGFPDSDVDHWDRNGLHNWDDNLRVATRSQNQANSPLDKTSTTGFKGVNRIRRSGKYRAYINVLGRWQHICVRDTAEEAARAYDQRALEAWGEFAALNFPQL